MKELIVRLEDIESVNSAGQQEEDAASMLRQMRNHNNSDPTHERLNEDDLLQSHFNEQTQHNHPSADERNHQCDHAVQD